MGREADWEGQRTGSEQRSSLGVFYIIESQLLEVILN